MPIEATTLKGNQSEFLIIVLTLGLTVLAGTAIVSQLSILTWSFLGTLWWDPNPDRFYLITLAVMAVANGVFLLPYRSILIFASATVIVLFLIYLLRWDYNFIINAKRAPIDMTCFGLTFVILAVRFTMLHYLVDKDE
jgi:hypothetical protein